MIVRKMFASAAIALTVFFGATTVDAHDTPEVTKVLSGPASWYGPKFHGRLTANGERFDQYDLTAAHRTLPFGTEIRVTNNRNGKSVVVRVNDRGPFAGQRVLDLSKGAARRIDMVRSGVAPVTIEVLERDA